MRTVHFAHSFSKLSETFIYDYIKGIDAHGIDTQVITMNLVNRRERPFECVHELRLNLLNPERLIRRGIDFIRKRPLETSSWPVYRKKMTTMVRDIQPDIIHAHFGPMGVLMSPVAKQLNIPLIVTFYGYDISEYVSSVYWQRKYHKLAGDVAAITVLSDQMKSEAIELGFAEQKTNVIHLGTDLKRFPRKKSTYPVREFLSVGRLSEKKGHLDSIKAIEKAAIRTGLPLHLTIIGEGSDTEKLRRYITENSLEKMIHLAGRRSNREVIESLYSSDAFILSSKMSTKGDREGTPTVLIEAQAAGLPCVSTYHSGIPEIIPEKNHGLLAPEGDVEAITDCIHMLVTATAPKVAKWAEQGREKAEKAFNIEVETLKFKRLYESLLV